MNYELESKLRNKAETWEVHNLQQEIRNQNNVINELRRIIGHNELRMCNQVYVIQRLITILIENEPTKSGISDLLYDIQNLAY